MKTIFPHLTGSSTVAVPVLSRFRAFGLSNFDEGERRRSAFTLIELIAVMGIIVALALLVVGGYSGISRAIAAGQGSRQVADTLLLARQTACVNGVRVYFYILSEQEYLLCRRMGICSMDSKVADDTKHPYGNKGVFYKKGVRSFNDFYTDLGSFVNEADRVAQSEVDDDAKKTMASGDYLFELPAEKNNSGLKYGRLLGVTNSVPGWIVFYEPDPDHAPDFKEGAVYGLALFPIRVLPKGFAFPEDDVGKYLYFEPTGSAKGLDEINIVESASGNKQPPVKITGEGKIDVVYPK
ncbi:MAG: type II secretion system protein [Kiritimatiellae bacterium]|nr:type II secretion system protein [Kiritimatiellia bacterium]